MNKVYVGDTGTAIILDTGTSLATATSVGIEVKKPNGSKVNWAGSVVESTKVSFVTLAGTLDQPGEWKLQAVVTLPNGTWKGETVVVRVYPPFA